MWILFSFFFLVCLVFFLPWLQCSPLIKIGVKVLLFFLQIQLVIVLVGKALCHFPMIFCYLWYYFDKWSKATLLKHFKPHVRHKYPVDIVYQWCIIANFAGASDLMIWSHPLLYFGSTSIRLKNATIVSNTLCEYEMRWEISGGGIS